MIHLLLPLQLATGPVTLKARLPEGARIPERTTIGWLDASGTPLGKSGVRLGSAGVAVTPPKGAVWVQALGPELFSRPSLTVVRETVELSLLPTGTLRVTGLSPSGELPLAYLAELGAERSAPASLFEARAASRSKDGTPTVSFRTPVGRYAVAFEDGAARVASRLAEVAIAPAAVTDVTVRVPEGRELVLRAVARESGTPVRGARLGRGAGETPEERALQALLATRAEVSGSDGVVALGQVPADGPLGLRLVADGRRGATVKLPALFEAGRRDVTLAPNQSLEVSVRGLSLRRGDPRPDVSLSRCRSQSTTSSCLAQDPKTLPLPVEGPARFTGVPGGRYQVDLLLPPDRATRADVLISAESDAPDTVSLELPVEEWTLRGTTRLRDGTPVRAEVLATEYVHGLGEGRASETHSREDGSFEIRVVSSTGRQIGLEARSDEPKGESRSGKLLDLRPEEPILEGLELELDSTGLEIAVRERRTGQPVPGCRVDLSWVGTESSGSSTSLVRTDAKGEVAQYGLAHGVVRVEPRCSSHAAVDPVQVTLPVGEVRRVELLVDRADDLTLTVLDPSARPVPGALVLGLAEPLYWFQTWGFSASPSRIGITDARGELTIGGNDWAGKPFFVVAEGRALAIRRFPRPGSCDSKEACGMTVRVEQRSVFAGLAVVRRKGKPPRSFEVAFSKDGIPIPEEVIQEAARANGAEVLRVGRDPYDEQLPSYFESGTYMVRTYAKGQNPNASPTLQPIGTVTVPLYERLELVDVNSAG